MADTVLDGNMLDGSILRCERCGLTSAPPHREPMDCIRTFQDLLMRKCDEVEFLKAKIQQAIYAPDGDEISWQHIEAQRADKERLHDHNRALAEEIDRLRRTAEVMLRAERETEDG